MNFYQFNFENERFSVEEYNCAYRFFSSKNT